MRQICLDTETTGLSPETGDRIVEVACVEIVNLLPTGSHLHFYVNPEREVPAAAFDVHGLNYDFLKNHPVFSEHVENFLEFIGEDPLIIHNAAFDLKFLNAELKRVKKPHLPKERAIDTLQIARKKFPGSPATLDALCKRFDISLASRVKHGALTDTNLLAEVYLHLSGGREPTFNLKEKKIEVKKTVAEEEFRPAEQRKIKLPSRLTEAERKAHEEFVHKDLKNAIWAA